VICDSAPGQWHEFIAMSIDDEISDDLRAVGRALTSGIRFYFEPRAGRAAPARAVSGTHPLMLMKQQPNKENQQSDKCNWPFGAGLPSGSVLAKAQFAILEKALYQLGHAAHLD
jgi:hypothetical protein